MHSSAIAILVKRSGSTTGLHGERTLPDFDHFDDRLVEQVRFNKFDTEEHDELNPLIAP